MDAADPELTRSFARQGSPEAFAALVQRHVDLVYSAARRQLRSQHLAEEATRLVFIALAQQAARVQTAASLAPWLIEITRRIAIDLMKREGRRPVREQPADVRDATASSEWARIAPVLDEALTSLDTADGTALLLRYFETKDLRTIGGALGVTEVAAQKRIGHAVDALRDALRRRGVEMTAGDLTANLSAYSVEIAPTVLAQTVTAAALAGGATAATLPLTAIGLSTGQRAAVLAAIVLGVGGVAFEGLMLARAHATVTRLKNENEDLVAQVRAIEDQRRTAATAADTTKPAAAAPAATGGNISAPLAPAKR